MVYGHRMCTNALYCFVPFKIRVQRNIFEFPIVCVVVTIALNRGSNEHTAVLYYVYFIRLHLG